MGKRAVHIDPLAYSGIALQLEFIVPQFSLSYQHKRHRTYGVELVIEEKTKLLKGLLMNKKISKQEQSLFVKLLLKINNASQFVVVAIQLLLLLNSVIRKISATFQPVAVLLLK